MAGGAIQLAKNDRIRVNSNDRSAGFLENKIISSDGSVDINVTSCGCELDLSVNSGVVEEWIDVDVDYTDFDVASSTINITPAKFTGLGTGLFILGYRIKHSAIFDGSGATVGSLQLIFSTSSVSSSLDVLQAVSNTGHISSIQANQVDIDVNSNDIEVRLFLFGGTGDNLTSGSAKIQVKVAYLL